MRTTITTLLVAFVLGLPGTAVAFVTPALPAAAVVSRPLGAPAEPSAPFFLDAFPVATTEFRYVSSWGAPRPGGRRHRGTDIHAPKGTPVVAVADGVVTRMGWNRLSGWLIEIEHADGWSSVSLHLNNDTPGTDDGEGGAAVAYPASLEVGSRVEAGQVIGYVGDSGNAEGTVPHVHFEIRHEGTRLNPYPFLESARIRGVILRAAPPALR